jgi:hypothetical protein
MVDEKLDTLINLALVDGILSDKEREVLTRKAQSLGIDPDEFEIILEAKLFEKNLKTDNTNSTSKEENKQQGNQSNKFGNLEKCPACGSLVPSFSAHCYDCGYEFRNVGANIHIQQLSDKMLEIENETTIKLSVGSVFSMLMAPGADQIRDKINKKKSEVIRNFSLPNTVRDTMDAILFIAPRTKAGFSADRNIFAWRYKYRELKGKTTTLYGNNKDVEKIVDDLNKRYYDTNFLALFLLWLLFLPQRTKSILFFIMVQIAIWYFLIWVFRKIFSFLF